MKVEPVTGLRRRAGQVLKELKHDGEPVLITERGKPAAFLVEAEAFGEQVKRTKLLEGLARGEMAFEDGRIVSQEKAKTRMAKWLE